MVNYSLPLYQNKPAVWNAAECAKLAKRRATDGLGTPYPFKGYIGCNFGDVRYNGGCIRNGEWWQGETRPFPIVAKGYKIVLRPTWGYQIVSD